MCWVKRYYSRSRARAPSLVGRLRYENGCPSGYILTRNTTAYSRFRRESAVGEPVTLRSAGLSARGTRRGSLAKGAKTTIKTKLCGRALSGDITCHKRPVRRAAARSARLSPVPAKPLRNLPHHLQHGGVSGLASMPGPACFSMGG